MEKHKPTAQQESFHEEKTTEHLEMQIPAQSEWVRVVRLATAGVTSRIGFSYEEIEDIKLAVTEACNNAILHSSGSGVGPAESTGKSADDSAETEHSDRAVVRVCWKIFDDGIRVSVTDNGRLESDELLNRVPKIPAIEEVGELPEGGMGLLLIESLMDEIEHEAGPRTNTTLHMTKYLQAEDSAPTPASRTRPYPDPDSPVNIGLSKRRSQTHTEPGISSVPKR